MGNGDLLPNAPCETSQVEINSAQYTIDLDQEIHKEKLAARINEENGSKHQVSTSTASSKVESNSEYQNEELLPETVYPKGIRFVLMSVGIMAAVLIVALDNYIIATAIPRLTTDFHSINLTGWYSSSYFLTIMAFQPAHGQLFTFFSIKRMFLYSILVFEIGSIISATAPAPIAFIIGRLVCGAASGGIWCGTLTLVAYAVPKNKRFIYLSAITSMYGVSSAAGPLLGGIFTDSRLTWRFCFWINLPIGFVASVLLILFLEPPPLSELGRTLSLKQKIGRIDFFGTLLLLTSFTCFFLAAQWGGTTYPWSDSRVWGCLLGFGLQIIAFGYLQVRLDDRATIPARILRNTEALFGLLYQLFISMVIAVQIFYLPFYFQSALGQTATRSGILTLPYVMTLLLSPMVSGAIITAYGHHVPVMYIGAALAVAGSALISTLDIQSSPSKYIGYQFLAALGAGIVQQIPFTAVPLALGPEDMATASAIVSFCNSLGPVMVLTAGNVLFTNELGHRVDFIKGVDRSILTSSISRVVDLSDLVSPELVKSVREALSFALSRTFLLAIPAAGFSLVFGLGVHFLVWKSKTRAKKGPTLSSDGLP